MYSFWLFFVACILHLTSALDTELTERIIGGQYVTDFKKHPYMGYLIRSHMGKDLSYCGATILSPKFILTAAHCVKDCHCNYTVDIDCHYCKEIDPEDFTLYTGSDVIDRNTKYGSVLDNLHVHPEYELYDQNHQCFANNDIAVGELRTPLVFSDSINKVQLPPAITKNQINDTSVKTTQWAANNTQCKVLGWGRYVGGGHYEKSIQGRKLKSLTLTLISNELCLKYLFFAKKEFSHRRYKQYTKHFRFCYDTQLCAIHPAFKSSTCLGDSGGPLICKGKQVGIISRVIVDSCVGINHPQFYTRLDIYVPWINSIIGDK